MKSVFDALPVRASEYCAVFWDKSDNRHVPIFTRASLMWLELGSRAAYALYDFPMPEWLRH